MILRGKLAVKKGGEVGMEKKVLLEKIRSFLKKDLWDLPEVREAVDKLRIIAKKYGLCANALTYFNVGYDPETRSIFVLFPGPMDQFLSDTVREIHKLQDVISNAVLTNLLNMLEDSWEIVNEL